VDVQQLAPGHTVTLGEVRVTEAEILDFARRYDPQPFHVDEAAARASVYGGLIASGWHTCALFMRLLADGLLNHTVSLGSPGVEEVRWQRPVRPGDTLRGSVEVVEHRSSRSKPDRAILVSRGTLTNQDGEVVLSLLATNLLGRERD
jgi:acyl dehydratase